MNKRNDFICIGAVHSDYLLNLKQNYFKNRTNPIMQKEKLGGVAYNVAKKLAFLELEDYEVIDLYNIHKKDDIIYFKTKYFYNIQLVKGKAINVLSGDRLSVKTAGKIFHVKCKYYFRKLTEEDKIKISLFSICEILILLERILFKELILNAFFLLKNF